MAVVRSSGTSLVDLLPPRTPDTANVVTTMSMPGRKGGLDPKTALAQIVPVVETTCTFGGCVIQMTEAGRSLPQRPTYRSPARRQPHVSVAGSRQVVPTGQQLTPHSTPLSQQTAFGPQVAPAFWQQCAGRPSPAQLLPLAQHRS